MRFVRWFQSLGQGKNWRMADAFFEAPRRAFGGHKITTEALKLRIANGIHTAMVYVTWLYMELLDAWWTFDAHVG